MNNSDSENKMMPQQGCDENKGRTMTPLIIPKPMPQATPQAPTPKPNTGKQ